jgi:hypothetical protein
LSRFATVRVIWLAATLKSGLAPIGQIKTTEVASCGIIETKRD